MGSTSPPPFCRPSYMHTTRESTEHVQSLTALIATDSGKKRTPRTRQSPRHPLWPKNMVVAPTDLVPGGVTFHPNRHFWHRAHDVRPDVRIYCPRKPATGVLPPTRQCSPSACFGRHDTILPWVPQAPSATTRRLLRRAASAMPMERRHHQPRSSAHVRSFWRLSTTIFVSAIQVMLAVRARLPLRRCWETVRHHRRLYHPGPRRLPYHGQSERECHDNCSDIKWLNRKERDKPRWWLLPSAMGERKEAKKAPKTCGVCM